MTSQRPLSEQNRPSDYPPPAVHSLLVTVGLVLVISGTLWALADPVRVVGLATVVGLGVVCARLPNQFSWRRRRTFHVPGTGFDIEITITRPNPSPSRSR